MEPSSRRARGLRLLAITLSLGLVPFLLYFILYVTPRERTIDLRNIRGLSAMALTVETQLDQFAEVLSNAVSATEPRPDWRCRRPLPEIEGTPDADPAATRDAPDGWRCRCDGPGCRCDGLDCTCDGSGCACDRTGCRCDGPDCRVASTPLAVLRKRVHAAIDQSQGLQLVDVQRESGFDCPREPEITAQAGTRGEIQLTFRGCSERLSPQVLGPIRIRARTQLRDLAPPRPESIDGLLIIDGQRRVLYQDAPSRPRLRTLPDADSRGAGGTGGSSFWSFGDRRPRLQVGAESYYSYEEDLNIALHREPPFRPTQERAEVTGKERAEATGGERPRLSLRAVALVNADHFTRERFSLPLLPLLCVLFLLVSTALLWPLFKLIFIGPRERLRAIDGQLLFFSVVATAGIATLLCLDVFYLKEQARHRHDRFKEIAEGIDASLESELRAAHTLLQRASARLRYRAVPSSRTAGVSAAQLLGMDFPGPQYGNFQLIVRIDRTGMQTGKWTLFEHTTPWIAVPDRDYVLDTRARRLAGRFHASHGGPPFQLGVNQIRSRNTAEKLTVLSIPHPVPELPPAAGRADRRLDPDRVGALDAPLDRPQPDLPVLDGDPAEETLHLSTRLSSLNDPVLPPGYGFAVIDDAGQVKFHSETRRSLEESFFSECEDNPALHAAVVRGYKGELAVHYGGSSHRLYLRPLTGLPWTLVVYQSPKLPDTANLQIIATSLICFALHMGFLALLRFIVFVLAGSPRSEWMWPEAPGGPRSSVRYRDGAPLPPIQAVANTPWRALWNWAMRRLRPQVKGPRERQIAQLQTAILLAAQLVVFILMLELGGRMGIFWTAVAMPLCAIATAYLLLEPSPRFRVNRRVAAAALAASLSALGYAVFCPRRYGLAPNADPVLLAWLAGAVALAGSALAAVAPWVAARVMPWLATRGSEAASDEAAWLRQRGARHLYILNGLLLLAIAGCCPAWAMFEDAAQLVERARSQLLKGSVINSLEQRANRLTQHYGRVYDPSVRDPTTTAARFVPDYLPHGGARPTPDRRRAAYDPHWSGIYTDFDVTILSQGHDPSQPASFDCTWFTGAYFTCPLWRYIPTYNDVAADLRMALLTSPGGPAETGGHRAQATLGALGVRSVQITERGGERGTAPGSWNHRWNSVALAALLCLFFLGVVSVVARRLFGVDVVSFPLPQSEGSAAPPAVSVAQSQTGAGDARCWLHMRPQLADRQRLAEGATYIDLRDVDSLLHAAPSRNAPLVLEHLEAHFMNIAGTQLVLDRLEQWVYRDKRTIHLITLVDPLYYLDQLHRDSADSERAKDDAALIRWSQLLACFDRLHYGRPELLMPLPRDASPRTRAAHWLIEQECGWDEQLHPLARHLVDQPGLDDLSDDDLLLQIANRAGPLHRKLWSLCANEEKLLLIRLAFEGYVNPKAWAVARRLERRGLLRRDPAYRISSESFRNFVATAMHPADLQRFESAQRGTWSTMSWPLLAVLAAVAGLVLWSQPALTNTLVAIVGASTAVIAGLIRIVIALRHGRAQLGEFRL